METYKVHLDTFEGPLDLLLHLIKKEDVDIYDISVSRLLAQYMEYLELARELDIDLAGEFLEMASELAYIKSRMLLPEVEGEEPEGPDPRSELINRLLEYQRYKEVAQALLKRPLLGQEVFRRPPPGQQPDDEILMEADTSSLLSAFQNLLKRLPAAQVHQINQIRMGVSERIVELVEKLRGREQMSFEDLFEGVATRTDLVVTFLAILEMAKQHLLQILQERVLHRIFVKPLISQEVNLEASDTYGDDYGNES